MIQEPSPHALDSDLTGELGLGLRDPEGSSPGKGEAGETCATLTSHFVSGSEKPAPSAELPSSDSGNPLDKELFLNSPWFFGKPGNMLLRASLGRESLHRPSGFIHEVFLGGDIEDHVHGQ